MTNQIRLAAAIAILFAQTPKLPPEAYPGQRDHREPPKGFYCSTTAKDAAHRCTCKRMTHATVEDKDCCQTPIEPDSTCTVYCWESRCTCPVTCEVKH